jgi:hypothetical protein
MTDLSEILAELRSLREIVQSLQPSVPPTQVCEGVTGKGTRCCNRAAPGGTYCRMHGVRETRPVKVAKPKKLAKPKKVQPEHRHGPGEVCMLCDTHGDVLDPRLPEAMFEGPEINNPIIG